jgi:hypothetical protein
VVSAEGAEVVVPGRNAERGAKTVQAIENAGGKTRFVAAEADEIANAVTFLASPAAGYVNGAVLTIVGGTKASTPVAAA